MTGHSESIANSSTRAQSPEWRRPVVVMPACLALSFCCAVTLPVPSLTTPEPIPSTEFITAPVERGTLQVVLTETGRIDSADNFVVASECEWTNRIIRLIPEGEWVEAGDIVVELDSSDLEGRLREREILVINAESRLIQAQEVVRLQAIENASGPAKAKLTKTLADLDLKKFIEGDFPKQQKEAQGDVALAKEDLTRSKERYEYVVRMAKKGYESPIAVEQQRLSLLKYEHALDKARRKLEVLVKYDSPRELAELQADASEAEREQSRVDKTSELALANRQILVINREAQLKNHLDYADRLQRNIEACTIRAPITGEIVYANEGSVRNEILEGEKVRYRQDVVRVPNLDELEVDVRIHESLIAGIHTGLRATITLDAFPDLLFDGKITSVARVPTAGNRYNRDLLEYDAAVRIEATPEQMLQLKPGLTAKVDIHIDHRDDCLQVPSQSVVNVSGRRVVFVNTSEGVEHREIEVGMMSDTGVEILSGLREDEQVLLSPRTTCSEQLAALHEHFGSEVSVENIGG